MKTPNDIVANCLMQQTRRAARQLTTAYEQAFGGVGLTGGQFSILIAVSVQGSIAITPLAEGLGMDRTTLSRGLKPLERRGLIAFHEDENDSRARVVSLMQKGESLLNEAIPLWEKAQARVTETLEPDELGQLQQALKTLGQL